MPDRSIEYTVTDNASLNALPILTDIIESCSGCGACCLEQGAPPDYVALALNEHFFDDPSFAEDAERYYILPTTARQRLEQYLQQSATGAIPKNGPCVWYQAESQSCGFYDFRPSTCRVFERSSPGCHIYRQRQGIERPGTSKYEIAQLGGITRDDRTGERPA